MNLISTLNAGVAAAANGWAEIYARGTMVRATVYYDFEASTSDSSGDNIDLDAYGAVEVYVNQLVDVIAKSPDGTVIRSWTDGYASPNVEVISPAFTGNDYVSGAAAVNEPTTLQAVLNLWGTNSGAPDWKVDIDGTPTTFTNAFGPLAGLVYNVKSPQFGAVGDGVTNDQAAIQAALAAASAAGGGVVFFPKGTYLTTSAIPLDNLVSMVGVGADQCVVTVNSSTERVFQLLSSVNADAPFVVSGLTFQASQSNTGSQLYIGATGAKLLVSNCVFGGNANSGGIGIEYDANCRLSVEKTWFNINSASFPAINGSGGATGSSLRIRDCNVVSPASFSGSFFDLRNTTRASITGCLFDGATNGTAGTYYAIRTNNVSVITGNEFTGGFTAGINYTGGSIATAHSNVFVAVLTRYVTSAILSKGSYLELQIADISSSTTPAIPDGAGLCQFVSTTTVPMWAFPTKLYYGQLLTLMIYNNSGTGWGPMSFPFSVATSNIGYPSISNGGTAAIQFIVSDLTTVGGDWRGIWSTG